MRWDVWEYLLTLSGAQLVAMGASPNKNFVSTEYDVSMHVRSGDITVT
jgi:hypothetical protein